MITYGGGAFGFEVLLRLHGSAIFKSLTLAVVSCGIFLLLYFFTDIAEVPDETDLQAQLLFDHPYPIGALVSAFSFLLVFRANFAYHRYWEAFTAIHLMHSKWLDFATEVASFHYQSERYKQYKPPAFGTYGANVEPIVLNWSDPENIGTQTVASTAFSAAMMTVSRERERLEEPMTKEELQDHLEEMADQATINGDSHTSSLRSRLFKRRKKDKSEPRRKMARRKSETKRVINQRNNSKNINSVDDDYHNVNNHKSSRNKSVLLGGKDKRLQNRRQPTLYNEESTGLNFTATARKTWREGVQAIPPAIPPRRKMTFDGNNEAVTPTRDTTKPISAVPPNALFLEEIAHLLSLLSAVALSTLRNDLEDAESPLIEFFPNEPWPHVDPDDYLADVRQEWEASMSSLGGRWIGLPSSMRYMLGLSRNDVSRTLYNAARPFRVIGNVSDAEIDLLQLARGPLAKVSLCSLWLQEFLSREHLQGSTGKIAPPIVSRLYQYVSEGMAGYNQARKIAYIPFPFPHAQITTLFIFVMVAFMPLLMLTFVHNLVLGCILNLFTVLCFVGLHEVARELENPFQNVPNDLPLNNYQAQFNESLMIMFYGYHPDGHNWLPPPEDDKDEVENDEKEGGSQGLQKEGSRRSLDVELGATVPVETPANLTAQSPQHGRGHIKRHTPFNIPEIVLEEEFGAQSVLSWESDPLQML